MTAFVYFLILSYCIKILKVYVKDSGKFQMLEYYEIKRNA